MPAETCRQCNRTIVLINIGGELVATEREVIQVVPLRHVKSTHDSEDGNGRWRSRATTAARQLHSGLCAGYVEQNRKERIAKEQREFNAAQRRAGNRNHGL